jgi:polar amino acid transport system substrate-binding protein
MKRRIQVKLTIIFIILFSFITQLNSSDLQKVKLQLQWKHQFEFAGFYAAKEKGFFKYNFNFNKKFRWHNK